jgi:hypothetical protein
MGEGGVFFNGKGANVSCRPLLFFVQPQAPGKPPEAFSSSKLPSTSVNTNQSIIVWTLKPKSLLPSLYKREEFPLFGKEGLGEIFTTIMSF